MGSPQRIDARIKVLDVRLGDAVDPAVFASPTLPPGALVAGVPARIKKTGVPADWVEDAVKTYVESGRAHRAGLRRLA